MIGVAAQDGDWEVVKELFELFKTPWEPFREDGDYDVVVAACEDFSAFGVNAEVIIAFGSGDTRLDSETGTSCWKDDRDQPLTFGSSTLPIYGTRSIVRGDGLPILSVSDDPTDGAVGLVSSIKNKVFFRIGFDLFEEVRNLLTDGQPVCNAAFDTLDTHTNVIRALIVAAGVELIEIPAAPANHQFFVCLTHDVDHPRVGLHQLDHTATGFLYRALVGSVSQLIRGRIRVSDLARNWLAVLKLPLVYLGVAKDFWYGFDRYATIEGEAASTFFVIPFKDVPGRLANGAAPKIRASKYGPSDILDRIDGLMADGCEIGLHGLNAWIDTADGRREYGEVRSVTGQDRMGVRMHWLYFDSESPVKLEMAGFFFDSTVGYNETIGFRAGTAQVYKFLGTDSFYELPLHVMDTALFYPTYLNLSQSRAVARICELLDKVSARGGVLTLNWHDRSIAPERNWGRAYETILAEAIKRGALCTSAGQTVSWFQKRRAIQFHAEADSVRVKNPQSNAAENLPGFRLRCHQPAGDGTKYVDSRLESSTTWRRSSRERPSLSRIRSRLVVGQIA